MREETPPVVRLLCQAAVYGFGVALLATLPFWWDRFSRTGSVFDDGFLERTSLLGGRLAHIDYAAGLVAMLLVMLAAGALFFAVGRFSPRARGPVSAAIAVIAFIPALNYLRIEALGLSAAALASPVGLAAGGAVGLALLAWFVSRRAALIRAIEGATAVAAFVGLVVVANGVVALARTMPEGGSPFSDDRPLAEVAAGRHGLTPVIWIIFDEWDYRLSFEARPDGLAMPAVDRLVAESFSATQATLPGANTAVSMPSLTTGLRVTESRQARAGDLMLKTADGRRVTWRAAASVFDRAKAMGARLAVLSHQFGPYCGSLHRALAVCWEIGRWWPERQNAFATLGYVLSYGLRFLPGIRLHVIRLYDPDYRRLSQFDSVNSFLVYQREVEGRLRSGGDDLLLLHYELPHSPVLFDRRRGELRSAFDTRRTSLDGYADNLALLDRTVARLRGVLEETGRWGGAALIVSSDHHFRHGIADVPTDPRVPFIVKLPGRHDGIVYDRPMNTLVTAALIPALLSGRIADYQALARFVTKRTPPHAAVLAGPVRNDHVR